MKQKHFTRLTIAATFAVALILAGAAPSLAGDQDDKAGMEHSGMGEPAMMEEGMMAMHQKMQAMDQRLDALVAEMNSVGAKQKADAVAAVVAELVTQRKAMHVMMMEMQPKMMKNMMEHMGCGMMEGMKQSMGDCPMMKQMQSTGEQGEQEEHSGHHPEG